MTIGPSIDIVCVAQPSWDGPYAKSTVLLMKQLATRNRVMYVDYAFTWKDMLLTLLGKQHSPVRQMLGVRDRLRVVEERGGEVILSVLTLPPMLPITFLPAGRAYDMLNKLNGWVAARTIRKAMKRIHMTHPVVVNAFSPSMGVALLNRLHEKLTVYYCYDEIKEADWSRKHGGKQEETFASEVDAVVVSSDSLKQAKASLNENIFVVKNGVDTTLFTPSAESRSNQRPNVPVVGFVGSLDSRVDYPLLREVIKGCPEFLFRFVGRVVDKEFETLKSCSNVEWVPPVAYRELPALIQEFDLGIIPFVVSPFTEKIYPLKINEYLAMGKPVVMTSFARLPEFDHIVTRIDSGFSFKCAILNCLQQDSEEKVIERIEFAKHNSWEERSVQFDQILEKRLLSHDHSS